jgi:ubiquinone/menaquinone biosynthesis C-methylase UbiE
MQNIDLDRTMAAFFNDRVHLFESFTPEEKARLRKCLKAWDIRPGTRVLEPGCGCGRLTELLVEAVGEGGEVLAFDVSPEMIRRAKARQLPSSVCFFQASAAAVPSDSDMFDRIICCCVFPHFLDTQRILSELFRVLRPGGRLIIQHLESREAVNEFHRTVAANAPSMPIPPDEEMCRLLERLGLSSITISNDGGYMVQGQKLDPMQ